MGSASAKNRVGASAAFKGLSLPRFARERTARPLVVAVEGPNGAGKTTLCHSLASALGVPFCLGTDPAWFTKTLKERMIRDAEWHASAMFFLSGCFEQMRLLRERSQRLVIMDRSLWSTLAVHGSESADRLTALIGMLRPLARLIQVPHLTLVLEASFATCQSRIAKKTGPARALDELTATEAFHQRERAFYRWLSGQTRNVIFMNVDQGTAAEVARQALDLVRKKAC